MLGGIKNTVIKRYTPSNLLFLKASKVNNPKEMFKCYKKLRNSYEGPILINMHTDPEIINPQKTINELRH